MKVRTHRIKYIKTRYFDFVLAANHCRLLRAKLWDIETIDEFAFVLDRIYIQTQSFDSPRIAVNFTKGRHR